MPMLEVNMATADDMPLPEANVAASDTRPMVEVNMTTLMLCHAESIQCHLSAYA